jgi:hypothetical protein
MDTDKPPSSKASSPCPYLVGRDSQGHWVVRDQSGLRGGLFVNRAEALKYAMFENGRQPQAVIMVPGVLELDMTGNHVDQRLKAWAQPNHRAAA